MIRVERCAGVQVRYFSGPAPIYGEIMRIRRAATMSAISTVLAAGAIVANVSPASADVAACGGNGTYIGQGENALTNGTLKAGFCGSSTLIKHVNIQYAKTGGSTVTLRFGWQYVNRDGSGGGTIKWDNGSFTESAGQTKTFTWDYLVGVTNPNGIDSCMRGVLKDVNAAQTYTTRVVCYY